MKFTSELRDATCQMGSHSVICYPTEVAAPPSPRAGWYSIYRPHKDERLSWPSWLIHWPCTNWYVVSNGMANDLIFLQLLY